jgi:hypothetical protein
MQLVRGQVVFVAVLPVIDTLHLVPAKNPT